MFKKYICIVSIISLISFFSLGQGLTPRLEVSRNNRFLMTENGEPFFWLGDTGWRLITKLNREEAEKYLEDRHQKSFNVIQVMVLHDVMSVNAYGDSALINKDLSTPLIKQKNLNDNKNSYDFWDHVDYILDVAAQKGIYLAMIPIWGKSVKQGAVNSQQAALYAEFLADRYKNKPNIIWLNGGDIKGCDSINIWNTLGTTLHELDPNHLITYHPFGRTQSSTWFHNEDWLSLNAFQSGHRDYVQDTDSTDLNFGEDNWKYINIDYNKIPTKPTLDAEPSYEGIPHGLHDTLQPLWKDCDLRRYAYWSVFAGGCGFTYGNNSVMQMHKPTDNYSSYGAKANWYDAINDPGASQMQYLKKLMLSVSYFDRVPDQSLIASDQGTKYNYLIATRGEKYAYIYTYNGRIIPVSMGKIAGKKVLASWYNPRNGQITKIGEFPNNGTYSFDPPGEVKDGNDWILQLMSK